MFFLGQNLSILPYIFLLVTYVAGILTLSSNLKPADAGIAENESRIEVKNQPAQINNTSIIVLPNLIELFDQSTESEISDNLPKLYFTHNSICLIGYCWHYNPNHFLLRYFSRPPPAI